MIKVIILDFDGVTVSIDMNKIKNESNRKAQYFKLSVDYIIDQYFFKNPYNKKLDLGEMSVKEVRRLDEKKLWSGPSEEYLEWWQMVEDSYTISDEMKNWLNELKKDYKLVMLTDNHRDFNTWLNKRPDINIYFDFVFNSAKYNIKKPDKRLFEVVSEKTNSDFNECIFIDDNQLNTAIVESYGMNSIHFIDLHSTKCKFDKILKNYTKTLH